MLSPEQCRGDVTVVPGLVALGTKSLSCGSIPIGAILLA